MSCAIGLKGEGILWVDEVKMMQKQYTRYFMKCVAFF